MAEHHEHAKAVLTQAAASIPSPPPSIALNPLLARGKLKKAKGGSKKKTTTLKDVKKAKAEELGVISQTETGGEVDPAEQGEVLDLADQLLLQLGGDDDEEQQPAQAIPIGGAPSSSTAAKPIGPPAASPSSSSARERLHELKEDFKDAFLPNRNTDGNGEKKVNRQQARKLRKADDIEKQRQEAHAEVAAENDKSVEIERDAIDAQCRKYKVHIKEVEPDGHCMYSSIADQANLLKLTTNRETYVDTRHHAAAYMRTHPDDFLPFLPSTLDPENLMSAEEYSRYCDTVERTAEWGGEPEIRALSLHYQAPIMVVQAGTEAVEHGGDLPQEKAMFISYHRKMYGLGEHYNSLRPIPNLPPTAAAAPSPTPPTSAAPEAAVLVPV